jgi:hypothetical protein
MIRFFLWGLHAAGVSGPGSAPRSGPLTLAVTLAVTDRPSRLLSQLIGVVSPVGVALS